MQGRSKSRWRVIAHGRSGKIHVCTMATLKDKGLAANVNDSMDVDGMAAADVTQASEQAKSREFWTKHW